MLLVFVLIGQRVSYCRARLIGALLKYYMLTFSSAKISKNTKKTPLIKLNSKDFKLNLSCIYLIVCYFANCFVAITVGYHSCVVNYLLLAGADCCPPLTCITRGATISPPPLALAWAMVQDSRNHCDNRKRRG